MTNGRPHLLTATLLIVMPLLFNVFFALLQATFDYPDILRRPPDEILRRFAAGGAGLVALWYAFAMTPLLFLPAAVLLRRALGDRVVPDSGADNGGAAVLVFATPLALAATLVQLLGLLRWPFLVPELARLYLDPATDAATRAAVIPVFLAFHQYLGVAVGEHLGYLFTAAWTVVIASAMLRTGLGRRWWAWLGFLAAGGIALGMTEPAGIGAAGPINALGYVLWSIWLIGVGVSLLRERSGSRLAVR